MDEIKKIAPHLTKIKRDQPFRVPDGYFDTLTERIDERIQAQKARPGYVHYVFKLKPYLAAAFFIFAFLISGMLIYKNLSTKNTSDNLEIQISQMVEQDLYSIPESTIIEVMNSDEVRTGQSGISSKEAVDYLINENTDIEQLINSN